MTHSEMPLLGRGEIERVFGRLGDRLVARFGLRVTTASPEHLLAM